MKEKYRNIAMLACSTMLGAVGQLLYKSAFLHARWFVLLLGAGVAVYITATTIYLYVLSRVHLSFAYGMGGMSYIFAVILAALILGENVPPLRWAGVLTITAGVVLVGLSG